MSKSNIKITVFINCLIFIISSSSFASDNSKSAKCQSEYLSCVTKNLDKSWSLWDYWNAGQLDMSNDDFDSAHLDIIFNIFACDDIALACKSNRQPDFKKFLEATQSQLEAEWVTASITSAGLNEDKIQQVINTASNIKQFRSLLVAVDGELVVEEYFSRKDDPRPQHIQSITKSITSLLIGIAIDKGYIESEKVKIKDYFPEYFSKSHDKRKQDITIEELLTMTSRLNFADSPSYSKYKDTRHWYEPGSWKAYWYADNFYDRALNIDLVETRDKVAAIYNTPACNLLTTILKKSVNMTSKEFADKYLFGPLGIKNYYWYHDSNNNYMGGHGIYMRPKDLAKIGQMILDGGSYGGVQLVSKEWLKKSFKRTVSKFVTFDDGKTAHDYGYLWWLGKYKGNSFKYGWGYGGQFLILLPHAKTIIVTTAYPDPDGHTHWKRSQKILKEIVFPIMDALPKDAT